MSKKNYIPIIVATFIWIWPPVIIKFLSFHFDVHTQNFYRYLSALVFFIPFNIIFLREKFLKSLKNIKQFILPAVFIFLYQFTFVKGMYMLEPAMVSFIHKSSVVFVAFLSFLFFADERRVMVSRPFIVGSIVAIIGVGGVILGKGITAFDTMNRGVLLILTASFFWALYIISIKKIVRKTDTIVTATIVFSITLPLFFAAALAFGDPGSIMRKPAGINTIMFASGIFCVGIAHAFNNKSIKIIGTAISSNFVLITPFFTAIASLYIFGEVLSLLQTVSGIALIVGCILLLRGGKVISSSCN